MDPPNVGPRSRVFSPWPHLIPGHKFMNLFSKGRWHPFLYKLSYLIYYLTWLFHLLWNLISPYQRQIFWHLFYYGRGTPIHNFLWRHGTMGSSWVWTEPSETSPPRNSQPLRCTWRETLYMSGWFITPSQNSGADMLYVISTWCWKFCLLVILN